MQSIYQQMKYRTFPEEIEAKEQNVKKKALKQKTKEKKSRCEDTHEICICYVKIINFEIGFIKMYEFGKALCEWIVECVCVTFVDV